MQKYKSHYDVVVIGAGLSGLTSAALLSKAGLSVCVLEMATQVGGYLAGFSRGDFRFDTSIHWLNQCGEGGIVSNVFNIIGSDYPKPKSQQRIRRMKGDSYDYLLTNDPEELKAKLIADFPHEEIGIVKLFKAAKKIGAAFDKNDNILRSPRTMPFLEKMVAQIKLLGFAWPFIPYIKYNGEEGMEKGLDHFFKDKELQKLFCAEYNFLSILVPIGWAYYNDFQSPPEGGSQVFAEWLTHVIASYENDVLLNAKADRIKLENGICKTVEFSINKESHSIDCGYVMSTCDIETLYEKLLPKNTVSETFLAKLRNSILYSSSVTVSLALDCPAEELGFKEELIFLARDDISREDHGKGDPEKGSLSILAPTVRDKSLAPDGKGTLSIYIPAFFDYENCWQTTKDEHGNIIRGKAYNDFKNNYAEKLISRVEKEISPELRKHILFHDVSTPITYWRYTGNKKGTMMGARPGKENMKAKIAHYQSPVQNLMICGHWSDLGGGVPIVVKAAVNASLLIIKRENNQAFKLLADYLDGKKKMDTIINSDCFKPYLNNWNQNPTPAQKYKLATV